VSETSTGHIIEDSAVSPPPFSVHCADVLSFLSSIDSNSVSLCLTDPPYGVTRHRFDIRPSRTETSRICREFFRISDGEGSAFIFLAYQQLDEWVTGLSLAGFSGVRVGVWGKTNCNKGAKPYPNCLEHFVFASKKKVYPHSLLPIYLSGASQRKRAHEKWTPFKKPMSLCRTLVLNHSALGGLVVDPFAGSGSVGVAALLEGRRAAINDIDASKTENLRNNLKNRHLFDSHKPLESFLMKKERRSPTEPPMTDEDWDKKLTFKAKVGVGGEEFKRDTDPKNKKDGSGDGDAVSTQVNKVVASAKSRQPSPAVVAPEPKKKSRHKFTPEEREHVSRILLAHNYNEQIDSVTFLYLVRSKIGFPNLRAEDIYWVANRIRTTIKRQTNGGTVISIPKETQKDRLMSLLDEYSQGGKKEMLSGDD
jgi:predicted RNA methylase